ncbi:MAG: MerR family transcriptional regulator [Chloroflexota bacterium]
MEKTFRIKQMASLCGVTAHTLRYYEKINLLVGINRDANGYRCFHEADVEWIRFLQQLKATGMPLAQMQQFAELRRQGDHTAAERREMLEQHRLQVAAQIESLNDCLGMIDFKIERHRQKERQG